MIYPLMLLSAWFIFFIIGLFLTGEILQDTKRHTDALYGKAKWLQVCLSILFASAWTFLFYECW